MNHSDKEHLPQDLEAIAARLRSSRAQADPLQLDQIKTRVMDRTARHKGRFTFMKSRIASVFTVAALIGGTGGAIAVASHSPSGGPNGEGAASGEYCNHKFPNPGECKGHHKDHDHDGKGHHGNEHHGH